MTISLGSARPRVSDAVAYGRPRADPDEYAPAMDLLKTALAGGGWVLCLGHIQPDGDALGSALAMAYALRRAGGRAVVSFDPGPLAFGMPPSLDFLPGEHLLVAPDQLATRLRAEGEPAAVITFDTGSAERLGRLAGHARVRAGGPAVLVVDHHARSTPFGSVTLLRPGAAATAELVAELIARLGVPLDRDMATCLYAGLASDTGSFRYAATTAGSHRLAARLLDAGVDAADISTRMWDTRPSSYLTVLHQALSRVRCTGDVIWTFIAGDDLAAAGATPEETEGVVDVLRVAREHEVAVVLKQDEPDAGPAWKASVRSRGRVDVGAACAALGGGGHRLAAGFTATGTPEQIIARLIAVLPAGG